MSAERPAERLSWRLLLELSLRGLGLREKQWSRPTRLCPPLDVRGKLDLLPELRRTVPILPVSQLPIDEEVAQWILEGKSKRDVRIDITVFF